MNQAPIVTAKRVYAIYDKQSSQIVNGLFLFPSDPPAVRFFGDVLADKNSYQSQHPADYELMCLGQLTERLNDRPQFEASLVPAVVITGAAWMAAQDPGQQPAVQLPLQARA